MSQVGEFIRRVRKPLDDEERNETDVHMAIEVGYEQCIVSSGITKATFLYDLAKEDYEVFAITVNHLFTPINWSKVKLRTLWGVRNEATGNLLTLERDPETDVYHLKETSEDPTSLVFAPMMTGSEEDAKLFISMLQQLPNDAPVGVGETLVSLDVDERINLNNREAVLVKIIF